MTRLDRDELSYLKLVTILRTGAILAAMAGLLALSAWMIAGTTGIIWTLAVFALAVALAPRISSAWVLRSQGARELAPYDAPELYRIVDTLAQAAKLPRRPRLFYLPVASMNAMAVGQRNDPSIAVTAGLVDQLSRRELAGVLAHEIAHIRHNDIWLMNLSRVLGRMTRGAATIGLLLLVLSLPFLLAQAAFLPLPLIVVLMASPILAGLLELALSRTREFKADLEAARLTGDPEGLASALRRIEGQGRFWERWFVLPKTRQDEWLRTHPPTEERVARLLSLREEVVEPQVASYTYQVRPQSPRSRRPVYTVYL